MDEYQENSSIIMLTGKMKTFFKICFTTKKIVTLRNETTSFDKSPFPTFSQPMYRLQNTVLKNRNDECNYSKNKVIVLFKENNV